MTMTNPNEDRLDDLFAQARGQNAQVAEGGEESKTVMSERTQSDDFKRRKRPLADTFASARPCFARGKTLTLRRPE